MLTLPGYQITTVIYEDQATLVYRGIDQATQAPVIIKTSQSERSAPREAGRLRQEYAILRELDLLGVARAEGLVAEQERLFLILNDIGGAPLTTLSASGPCPLETFFAIALPLTTILGQLHRHHIIHKDIKPHNIIYNQQTGQLELIDFGLASRLSHEHPYLTIPDQIEGTFAYLAPEQTGRMNRTVDYRCDFYALGVTLYQLLTGQLPFYATDPLEWVHCHIARTPRSPSELVPTLPAPLAAIVLKLLAKLPEERYQSAQGLYRDLAHCQHAWRIHGRIADFVPGAYDVSDRFQIPQRLYGREAELAALLAAFERMVASGKPELVLVTGAAGIGKSVVINELHKPITRAYGTFITGKVDQYQRDIPYAPIRAAFGRLVQQLLAKSEERIGRWRERLLAALGPNGQLMTDFFPQLELIIGPQPPVAELPLLESQNRFHLVFRNFMAVFTRPDMPLVIFLDDLQWLDSASLQLLKYLITAGDAQHWLLVGAYRTTEVNAGHPLLMALDDIGRSGTRIETIELNPLSPADLGQLVGDTLRCTAEQAAPLVETIAAKTLGNPFFSIQFLTMLHRQALITFDAQHERWTWDLSGIQAQHFTDNVAELMISELELLPPATQQALQQGACLGNTFELAQLALVAGRSVEALADDLWPAADRGLILLAQEHCHFLHDRVQEAAYSLVPAGQRAALRLRIGYLLLAHVPPEQLNEHIFTIVNHLNQGSELIETANERGHVAELNLRAGIRARATTAYAAASGYLGAGGALLAADSWLSQYDLTFALHRYRAECEFLVGNALVAEQMLEALLRHARAGADRLAVARLQTDIYTAQGRADQAVAAAIDGLRQAGLELPARPSADDVLGGYQAVWAALGDRPIETLRELPLIADPAKEAMLNLLAGLQAPATFTDPSLALLSTCHAVMLALQAGQADCCGFLYISFGIMLARGFNDHQRGYQIAKVGYDLVEQGRLRGERAKVYLSYATTILPYIADIRTSSPILQRAVRMALDDGDVMYACFSANGQLTISFLTGRPLGEAEAEAPSQLAFLRTMNLDLTSLLFSAQYRLVQCLRGQTRSLATLDDASADPALRREEDFEAYLLANKAHFLVVVSQYYVWKLAACWFAAQFAAAAQAAAQAKDLIWASYGVEVIEYHFYAALALAAHYPAAAPEVQAEYLSQLEGHLRQFQLWDEGCPVNFAYRQRLVAAEIARITGQELAAEQLYEQAIRAARSYGFVHYEAIACECAARFYAGRGFERIAEFYFGEARAGYQRWGATGKVRLLDAAHPHLRERAAPPGSTSNTTSLDDLDTLAIIKASQAISGQIILGQLLDTLLRTMLEQAGAQRGDLLLWREGRLVPAASAQTMQEQIQIAPAPNPSLDPLTLPQSVLNYVLRSRETVLLADVNAPHAFDSDPYILQHQPKSLLCIPIMRQSTPLGILYLEHHLLTHAFAPAQVAVLELLAAQAAISLENALLYDQLEDHNRTLEQKVSHRTADLHAALGRVEAHATELKGANIRLEGLLHFARFMQHEVRGYAAGLEGLTPLLRQAFDGHPLAAQYDEHLVGVEETVAQMNDLTQRMLILTREGTLPQQQHRMVVLRPLLEQVCAKTAAFARRYDLPVQLTLEIADDIAISGDPLYLSLAFFTGLRNVVEVMAEQDLDVTTAITITATVRTQTVHVCLSDNGPGFPAALLEAIHVARQSEGRFVIGWSSKTGGSGLGLALMDRVAQLHGGSLAIGNHAEQPGAWIDFTLPREIRPG